MSDAYKSRGVSSSKEEVHSAVSVLGRGVFAGAFCKLIEDPAGDDDYCVAMHADGAGTKAALAYIKFKETGDYGAYFDIAQDSMVMNLDDLLCVGALDGFIMSNTIDRNAHRVDGHAIKSVIDGYRSFVELMGKYGIGISMSGGETADVGDLASTLIVNSTLYVRIKRSDVIDCNNIAAGDVIIGLASSGQANYESKYNAGMGSNGLTAARHLLLSKYYAEKYPETYSPTIAYEKVYCGKYRLEDRLPGADISVGDAILSPTRTYAPVLKKLHDEKAGIHGIIHCTGGGQVKCRGFGEGLHYVKDDMFEIPPLFMAIADGGEISAQEMYQTFNMGHRLEIFCPESEAQKIIDIANSFGVDAKQIGHVEASTTGANTVTIFDRMTGKNINY